MVKTKIDIKQELRRRLQEALYSAKYLPPIKCRNEIRKQLTAIQMYCKVHEKTFIFVEQRITCNQYELGGDCQEEATLFRGPNEDASVAICVTDKGSLLHRNSCPWEIYRDAGDTNPERCLIVELVWNNCVILSAIKVAKLDEAIRQRLLNEMFATWLQEALQKTPVRILPETENPSR